jgi:Glycosyltransferase family 92
MFHCTSLSLPPEAAIKRESTRPFEFRQPGFDEAFDATTLFYDLILSRNKYGNKLVFIGPPFLNLFPSFYGGRIGGRPLASTVSNYYLRDGCSEVWIPNWDSDAVHLELDFGSYRLTPQNAATNLYRGKRVLYTLSRDNELIWITDWVRFHARNHGANAVLIYNNASTKYSGEDLERSLKEALPGFEINVVDWPYKYGPQGFKGGWWDSNFCQAGAFQDARFRFLDSASSVLNCDIDEFVVSEKGESIFDIAEKSKNGFTIFNGRWISNVTVGMDPDLNSPSDIRHGYFRYLKRTEPACPKKWCVVPQRCKVEEHWGNHTVSGKDLASSYSDSFSYRHFQSISTNWKYQRVRSEVFDPKLHQFDETLDKALLRAEIARPEARAPRSLLEIVRQRCDRIKSLGTRWKRRLKNIAQHLRWLVSQLYP